MKAIKIRWDKLTLAQAIVLGCGLLVLGAVLLFGKSLGLDADYVKAIVGALALVTTGGAFLSNSHDGEGGGES